MGVENTDTGDQIVQTKSRVVIVERVDHRLRQDEDADDQVLREAIVAFPRNLTT